MDRNYPDWLDAYFDYSRDEFCPDKFHRWSGVSAIAGALERKVWIERQFNLYPNMFILMVAPPAIGKSTATDVAVKDFLMNLKTEGKEINFLATQNSEASFIDQMTRSKRFTYGVSEIAHSSSYLYASEASNALKEIAGGGSFISCLTEFYDCPTRWKKQLMSRPEGINIFNGCLNIMACCTFSHLKKLVPKDEAEGGFASRLVYIIHDEVIARSPRWRKGGRNPEVQAKLLEDLQQIYALKGPFRPTDEFVDHYQEWFPKQDLATQQLGSERLKYFMARKHTNVLKLSMICSISETSSLVLEKKHWDRALALIEEEETKISVILDNSVDKGRQEGLTYFIMRVIASHGGTCSRQELISGLAKKGIPLNQIDPTLQQLTNGKLIITETNSVGMFRYRLLVKPQDYI